MQHVLPEQSMTLGADLRALRKSRGLTLVDLAERLDRSVGWLSQVERDKSEPSITDLRQIAAILGVSLSMLFRQEAAPAGEAGYVVRKAARRPIDPKVDGLIEELLSPDLTDDFEMVHSTFEPGSGVKQPVTRPTQEVAFLLSGTLTVEIAGVAFRIKPGDSFRIRGEPFRWWNPGSEPAVAIWVIAPPVY
ncbi:MAG: helix-turn-helix domain-containing protein [Roseobacter sp.]|jgi:transcriptional regulator with XRE-family HTH domain|nr:helix-turn-helix domain-containing protein [Roseobacter sp.]